MHAFQNNRLMYRLIPIIFFLLAGTLTTFSQNIEEDQAVLFMKANVLFESGRYDEAVRMYNRILAQDENHTPSILMRARTKYELGAFKGTKNDALLYIEKTGVNKDIIRLMAQTELKLSNLASAKQ